eukprot:1161486-Pelagomonas_calceolata.AAC.7
MILPPRKRVQMLFHPPISLQAIAYTQGILAHTTQTHLKHINSLVNAPSPRWSRRCRCEWPPAAKTFCQWPQYSQPPAAQAASMQQPCSSHERHAACHAAAMRRHCADGHSLYKMSNEGYKIHGTTVF